MADDRGGERPARRPRKAGSPPAGATRAKTRAPAANDVDRPEDVDGPDTAAPAARSRAPGARSGGAARARKSTAGTAGVKKAAAKKATVKKAAVKASVKKAVRPAKAAIGTLPGPPEDVPGAPAPDEVDPATDRVEQAPPPPPPPTDPPPPEAPPTGGAPMEAPAEQPSPLEAPAAPPRASETPAPAPPAPPAPTRPRAARARALAVAALVILVVALGVVVTRVAGPSGVKYDELRPGDCLEKPGERFVRAKRVDCAEPHDLEVFALVTDPAARDARYPGPDILEREATVACLPQFQSYVGIPFEQSELRFTGYVPTERNWEEHNRLLVCTLSARTGRLTGTVKDSRR